MCWFWGEVSGFERRCLHVGGGEAWIVGRSEDREMRRMEIILTCVFSFAYARKRYARGIDPSRIKGHDGSRACFVLEQSGAWGER